MDVRIVRVVALVVMALAYSRPGLAADASDFLFRNTQDDGNGMPYRLFVPPGYDPARSYPLIIYLHGSGEHGTNNTSQLNNRANNAMNLIDDANLTIQPVLMAAPQCPNGSSCWANATQLTRLHTMIDRIAGEFSIDAERIHVTGLSMGGNGTWALVASQPHRFASATPICGWGNTAQAASLQHLPFWFFHSVNDPTVGVSGSRNLVTALRNAGARIAYTEYELGGHASWNGAFANPLLFRWMIAQQRGAPHTHTAPVVRIEQPSAEPVWSTDLNAVALSGAVDNEGHAISGVAWRVLGGNSGAASGSTEWSTPAIDLAMGSNDITVTATGSSYHPSWGGATTISVPLRVNRLPTLPQPGDVVLAVNSGGPAFTAADGTVFEADRAFQGGSTQVSNRAIAGTEDDPLYNDWRFGNFSYRVAVPDGLYEVDLHFAETYNSAVGQRRFNVGVDGNIVLAQFDIAASVGLNTALVDRYPIEASGGEIVIQVSNGEIGNARLDALKIVMADEGLFSDGFDGE